MFQNRLKSRKAVIGFLPLGLMFVMCSNFVPNFIHPAGKLTSDWIDGLRGLVLGLGIAIEFWVVIQLSRQRHAGRN